MYPLDPVSKRATAARGTETQDGGGGNCGGTRKVDEASLCRRDLGGILPGDDRLGVDVFHLGRIGR